MPRQKKQLSLEELPGEVRLTVIKLMSEFHLDSVEAGLCKMTQLYDAGSKAWWDATLAVSETKYRSRHFGEMNKTIATIQKDAEKRRLQAVDVAHAKC